MRLRNVVAFDSIGSIFLFVRGNDDGDGLEVMHDVTNSWFLFLNS